MGAGERGGLGGGGRGTWAVFGGEVGGGGEAGMGRGLAYPDSAVERGDPLTFVSQGGKKHLNS